MIEERGERREERGEMREGGERIEGGERGEERGERKEERGERREERGEERGPLTVVCNAVNHVFSICPSVHPHQEGADLSTTRMFAVYCFLCNRFCCCS